MYLSLRKSLATFVVTRDFLVPVLFFISLSSRRDAVQNEGVGADMRSTFLGEA